MADLNLSPDACKMGMNDFETGFLASSRQVALLLFGWSGRVGSAVCFFVLILNNAPALRAGNQTNPGTQKNQLLTFPFKDRLVIISNTLSTDFPFLNIVYSL